MYCSACGQKNDDEARFCIKCGKELHTLLQKEAAMTSEEQGEEEQQEEKTVFPEAQSEEPVSEAWEVAEEPVSEAGEVTEASVSEAEEAAQEPVSEAEEAAEAPVSEVGEAVSEPPLEETKKTADLPAAKAKVKGFGKVKFSLNFLIILFTLLAGASFLVDMFVVRTEGRFGDADTYEYIKGTDIFKMINNFGDLSGQMKTFVIASVTAVILVIGIALVQFFIALLWRSKGGFICMIFTSVMAIAAEGIMIGFFLENYVMDLYNSVGFVGYGPAIALFLHFCIIILSNVNIKLNKINSIVNG